MREVRLKLDEDAAAVAKRLQATRSMWQALNVYYSVAGKVPPAVSNERMHVVVAILATEIACAVPDVTQQPEVVRMVKDLLDGMLSTQPHPRGGD